MATKKKNTKVKKLFLSKSNLFIGGVCGGLGEYFNLDPTLVRVIFILTTFIWGSEILLYLILWVIIPSKSASRK